MWRAQAAVDGAVEVPIYIPETQWSVVNLLKQASNFGLGGWWLGGSHMIPNGGFLSEVQAKIPKDAKVIVACQKGLRCVPLQHLSLHRTPPDTGWLLFTEAPPRSQLHDQRDAACKVR
jgi:hypothetical protein